MIRPDSVVIASTLPNYMNIGTASNSMVVSGTVAAGATANFSCNLPIARSNSRFDVYAQDGDFKQLLNNTNFLNIFLNSGFGEAVSMSLKYTSSQITFTISTTNNTGSPITLTTQTVTVTAVEYRSPY